MPRLGSASPPTPLTSRMSQPELVSWVNLEDADRGADESAAERGMGEMEWGGTLYETRTFVPPETLAGYPTGPGYPIQKMLA